MADFRVNPVDLSSVSVEEERIRKNIDSLVNQTERIKNSLSYFHNWDRQIRAKLNTVIEESQNNEKKLKKMSSELTAICDLYYSTEQRIYSNAGGAGDVGEYVVSSDKKSFSEYMKEFLIDTIGKMGAGGNVISKALKYITGTKVGEGRAFWLDLVKDGFGIVGGVAAFIGKDKADQTLRTLFGATTRKTFSEALNSEFGKYGFVYGEEASKLTGAQVVAKNTSAVAKWGGAAVTLVSEMFENYEENKDSEDKLRWVKEAVGETGVNILEDIAIGAAVGSVVPGVGTVVGAAVAAGGTVIVKWGINAVSEALFEKKFDEFVSDILIDPSQSIKEGITVAGKKISSWWNKATSWGKKVFA